MFFLATNIDIGLIQKEVYFKTINNTTYNQQNTSDNMINDKKNIVIDVKSKYEKYLEKSLSNREIEIEKYKKQVLEYLNKSQEQTNIPTKIQHMIDIENKFKFSDIILVLKFKNGKFLFKIFKYKNDLYLLIINPILVYENIKNLEISEKYKKELIDILKTIAVADIEQKGKDIVDTFIYKQLKKIEKDFNIYNFYSLINLKQLKLNIKIGPENKTALFNFKNKLNLNIYNNYYYIPEKLKYILDNKYFYLYIPISKDDFDIQNKFKLNLNNSCFYLNFDSYKITSFLDNNIAFCVNKLNKNDTKIVKNNFYNALIIDVNDVSVPTKYNIVEIDKRPSWTIILDLLIISLGVIGAWLVFNIVNKQEKQEEISEKEIL